MTILNVIEYEDEGLAIIEDDHGKYAVTSDDPTFIPLDPVSSYSTVGNLERQRMLT